jgi:hypothetical protein
MPPRGRPTRPEARALARGVAGRLRALEEGSLRTLAAAREVAALEPGLAADVVGALVDLAAEGDPVAVAAVARALDGDSIPYPHRAAIYEAAVARGLDEVSALLLAPRPRVAWEAPRDKPDPRLARLTLGHKKALARTHRDPDLLARLAAEGEPTVVRELLRNPRLTEEFAVRLAARRPCRPETLRCLFEDRRWRTRPRVATALAHNPYVETEIALKLLPVLPERNIADLGRDGAIHPLVRAAAARLLELRGGAPRGEGGGA